MRGNAAHIRQTVPKFIRGQGSSHPHAFTLIELILSIAIMAIVLIAVNAVFFSAVRLHESSFAAVGDALPLEQTLATIRRDLQGAMPPSDSGVMSGNFKAGNISTLGIGLPVNLEIFTTTGVLRANEPWGEVQKVTYGLRQSSGRNVPGQDLYRSVTRNLLATIAPQPEDQWMMSGVQSIEFSCYDGTQWRSDWDTTMTDTNLPSAVRVRILLANRDGSLSTPRPVEMLVPIVSQSRTNATSMTDTNQ